LHDTGKAAEGIGLLQEALSHHPYDRDILFALASYELEAGDYMSALSRAELLRELEPENPQVHQLLTTINQATKKMQ
jgi:Flp pilus assembly protein TadD